MTHYLRTFEHLAPTEHVAPPRPPRRRRRGAWIALPFLALLALIMVRRPHPEPPPAPEAKRADAPRLALAPSEQQAPAADVPPVRVVEREGPKLIEKLLAEKFGTPLPKPPVAPPREAEPPPVAAPKPAPPVAAPPVTEQPQIADMPRPAEQPPAQKPVVVAAASPRLTPPLFPPRPVEAPIAGPELPAAKPAPAPVKPSAKTAPRAEKQPVAAKPAPKTVTPPAASKPEPKAPKPDVARKAEPAAPMPARVEERPVPVPVEERAVAARVEEQPVVVARTEPAERVEAAGETRPTAVVERPVPVPVAAQAAVPVTAPHEPSAPAEPQRVASAVKATETRPTGPSHDAVRGLLARYAAAWRGHDVDTLRAIGQVTNESQASALRAYFANVGDLEVEVRVLDIRSDGDRATVRFTRRDTFRDPTGRQIAKESPPIEKNVVTTPQGLRFAPSS